jgi:hypothetical protein
MKCHNSSICLIVLVIVLFVTGCSPSPVVISSVGALSQVRMVARDDPEGKAQRAFPSGVTTVWCAFGLQGSELGNDSYALNVVDSTGSSIAQVSISKDASIPVGTQMIMGNPTRMAMPIQSESGGFPDGDYRLEIMLNGQTKDSIPWSVGR